jgi:glutamyl/glutaminyl-tRNA synthetase
MERLSVWSDIETMKTEGEIQYYFAPQTYDAQQAIWKKSDKEHTIKHLSYVVNHFENYAGVWSADLLKESIWEYAEEHGKGDVLWPLRYSLSGRDRSPDPFMLLFILGKESSIERIKTAIHLLEA